MTVTVDISPSGGGTVEIVEIDGGAPSGYPDITSIVVGTRLQLEAVPASGYHFTGWVGEPTIDSENPIDFKVIRNMRITAHFVPDANEFTSEDEMLNIIIPEETTALNGDDAPLTNIEFIVNDAPPLPQEGDIVGLAYNIEPDEATFDPPVTLTWYYEPADIPSGVAEEDLIIAYYDGDADRWVDLPSEVDTGIMSVSAPVEHFTTFAIIAPVAPLPPPLPATFTTSSLSISPLEVSVGESVNIGVLLANTGEEAGSCSVTLKINGVTEETKEITLAGGASEKVIFTMSRNRADTYSVDVNGFPGSFTVSQAASPPLAPTSVSPAKPSWWLIGGIIAAVVMAIAIPLTLRWHRRRDEYGSIDKYIPL